MREYLIKDTMSGELKPIDVSKPIGIYACGPTVYSRIHIGNARPFVVFTLLRDFLRSEGLDARLAVNITDINDKIYVAADSRGVRSETLAEEMTNYYISDTDSLMLGRPDFEPRATESIDSIVALITDLIQKGFAYESGGDVYFDVEKIEDYGQLSHRPRADLDSGEPDSESLKRHPADFALWKASKGEDAVWDSPWGKGRPGWHIECSAMAADAFPEGLAIHGGGSDLVFPHHENEISQSEAAGRKPFAKIWMHNGMVRVKEEKMSKSEGNIFLLHTALDTYGRDAVILYLISGHYRQPTVFSDEELRAAVRRIERWKNFLLEASDETPDEAGLNRLEDFRAALRRDFNTPNALAVISETIKASRAGKIKGGRSIVLQQLKYFGLDNICSTQVGPSEEVLELLKARESARSSKDFGAADRLRDEIESLGWVIEDSSEGPVLNPK